MKELISSLHDDVFVPKATGHLGEYKNYPERMDASEKSVITRLEQFGINIGDIEEIFGKKAIDLNDAEYGSVMSEVIKGQYDTIVASVFDQYMFPSPESPDNKVRSDKMLKLLKQFEEMNVHCGVNLVKQKNDFQQSGNVVLSLEAGAHLINSVADARELASKGIKIFGLQYGVQSGINNSLIDNDGLTSLGRDVVRDMLDNNLIIDLAHTFYKPRQEVMEIAKETNRGNQVSYTHGSTVEDLIDSWKGKVGENRLLTQQEVKDLIKMGGIIGLGVSKPFFDSTRKIAERIDDISQLDNGVNSIAIGTDFGGVAPEWLNEIKSPSDFHILAEMLSSEFGMSDETINSIIRSNVKQWIKNAIK